MKKKINYEEPISTAKVAMEMIYNVANKFQKNELSHAVHGEIEDIILQSNEARRLQGVSRDNYSQLIEHAVGVEDDLEEICMLTSELIQEVNSFPDDEKENWYKAMRIEEIYEWQVELQDDPRRQLHVMNRLVENVLEESDKYYSDDLEDFAEYESDLIK